MQQEGRLELPAQTGKDISNLPAARQHSSKEAFCPRGEQAEAGTERTPAVHRDSFHCTSGLAACGWGQQGKMIGCQEIVCSVCRARAAASRCPLF
ncbi:hypothetical protein Y1Q_0021712 [Alligator mississippiensis]|uniref:Uncharacterized protein n=1 Tax=Alligator mississippiensis TaxID=8496 RepID=A0A151PBM3_ALLMI|nr:hypothetical protein Y1Q_0021712 [Alligator mississippiensis]